jgi:hypothetical protein
VEAKRKTTIRPYLLRLGIVLLISLVGVFIFNEITYRLQKDQNDRTPQTITLEIPAGTAEQIAAGQDTLSIPQQVYIIGDVIEVVNQDSVSHQLGPIWVPAGATGRLVLEMPEKLAYTCSFQADKYLEIDVIQGTTLSTRLTGLFLAAPATAIFVFIYSLLIFPVDRKPKHVPAS